MAFYNTACYWNGFFTAIGLFIIVLLIVFLIIRNMKGSGKNE